MTISPDGAAGGAKTLKLLMLHGYTQSGRHFRAKTRALEKTLNKALASSNITLKLIYPTAPNRLLLSKLPSSYRPLIKADREEGEEAQDGEEEEGDHWAWYRKDDATNEYLLLEEGINTIAQTIEQAGGIHGVCGFSQGATTTAFVVSALEPSRPLPDATTPEGSWARKLRAANRNQPALFGVAYSGFAAPPENLNWLYEPKIRTPMIHYIGSLDTLVEESRSRELADKCETSVTLIHPGGHHVPIAKNWVMPLAAFILKHAKEKLS